MPKGIYVRTESAKKNMSKAHRGKIPWNKGKKKCQVAWNKGLKGYLKGRKIIWADKISSGKKNSLKSTLASQKAGKIMGLSNLGKKHSKECKQKHRKLMLKEKNPNWNNGSSFFPYPAEFNQKLKLEIRQRDNFICCLCGKTEEEEMKEFNRVLSVNHIDFNKNNCKKSNLNTLCLRCNIKINRKKDRESWTIFFKQSYEKKFV
jgi:hypothetical protein